MTRIRLVRAELLKLVTRRGLMVASFLLTVGVTLAISLLVAGRLGTSANPESQIPNPDTFWRDVFPIGLGIVLSALYFRIDVFLVQWWRGTDAVALYNAVFRLVEALRLLPAAVLAVTLPTLVRASDTRMLVRVSASVVAIAVVASAALWVAAGSIVPIVYGSAFAGAVPAFRILVLSFPLLSLNYALTHQLVAWNGQRAYAAICAMALVVNVTLNARLIPALSIEGAAWATFATELFLTMGCAVSLLVVETAATSPVATTGSAA